MKTSRGGFGIRSMQVLSVGETLIIAAEQEPEAAGLITESMADSILLALIGIGRDWDTAVFKTPCCISLPAHADSSRFILGSNRNSGSHPSAVSISMHGLLYSITGLIYTYSIAFKLYRAFSNCVPGSSDVLVTSFHLYLSTKNIRRF